jgi:AraC-like DNA-binding protein
LRPAHWMLLGVIVTAGFAQSAVSGNDWAWLSRGLRIGFRLIYLVLIFHVFWLVWKGRSVDLIEKRARLRLIFLVGTGTATALIVLTALVYAPAPDWPLAARFSQAAVLLLLNLGFAIYLLQVDRDVLPAETTSVPSSRLTMKSGAAGFITDAESDQDAGLLTRLEKLMRHREVWRETGLTIGDLAARAAVPEHRLRRVINQRLGFRNFTAFLNEYRLSAAALRLADRDQTHIPVLTIALELGWGSIGPFNRAFRTRFGMTPTDDRREQLLSFESSA